MKTFVNLWKNANSKIAICLIQINVADTCASAYFKYAKNGRYEDFIKSAL